MADSISGAASLRPYKLQVGEGSHETWTGFIPVTRQAAGHKARPTPKIVRWNHVIPFAGPRIPFMLGNQVLDGPPPTDPPHPSRPLWRNFPGRPSNAVAACGIARKKGGEPKNEGLPGTIDVSG